MIGKAMPGAAERQDGFIALLAVLIVGAASLAIATALLASGADTSRLNLAGQQGAQARQLAEACAEEALQVIRDNTAYNGTTNLTLGRGTCSYRVTSTGVAARTIIATGTVGDVVKHTTVYGTINGTSISITSWQETP